MQKEDITDLKKKFESSNTVLMLAGTAGSVAAVAGQLMVSLVFTAGALVAAFPMIRSLFQNHKELKNK